MNSKTKKLCAVLSAIALTASMGTAFAAESTEDYGYRQGKANIYGTGGEQTFVYDENSADADYGYRQGKANIYGTGGEQTFVYDENSADADYGYRQGKAHRGGADSRHIDSGALVEAGIIDQATADAIAEYASKKHEDISALHENAANMTSEERKAAFEERKAQRKDGVDELVEAGIITEEQAEAIKNYTPEE